MPSQQTPGPVTELDEKTLQCTRTGQVMLDYANARSLMDEIRDYYEQRKSAPAANLKQLYYSELYAGVNSWRVGEYHGASPSPGEIRWQSLGRTQWGDVSIDRYVLYHSHYLEMPLLWIHKSDQRRRPALLLLGENGKATAQDWPEITKYLDSGYDVVSIDPRGLGETRMPYKAVSPDDPALAQMDFDQGYMSPLSGVLADYVYNSILTGRPYFLQMIEDVEIASRFVHAQLGSPPDFFVTGSGNGYTLASAVAETLTGAAIIPRPDAQKIKWSDLVDQRRELWPIQFLLPGGAYVH
ncbi:MAG: hypothetical protein JOY93_12375 [Acidobacteriales bacterium]|nr:hypothetical protein [Terriglobales bacterium]